MKFRLLIVLSLIWTQSFGQGLITGNIIDLRTMKQVSLINKNFQFFLVGKKQMSVYIDSVGQFEINKNEIFELGDTVNLQIGTLGTNFSYADFELINIPTDKIDLVLKRIFVTRAFMIPTCGADCFTVDNRRTFKKKTIMVDNGTIKYLMKRVPQKRPSNSPFYKVIYQTDFKTDRV